MNNLPLPGGPGVYALLIDLTAHAEVVVGRLGCVTFRSGYYLYFGSAMNGLAARVRRHLEREKRLHWHIDYLTCITAPEEVWWSECGERAECLWAEAGTKLSGASVPTPGFGSSDCRCRSHLVHIPTRPGVADMRALLGKRWRSAVNVISAGDVESS